MHVFSTNKIMQGVINAILITYCTIQYVIIVYSLLPNIIYCDARVGPQ